MGERRSVTPNTPLLAEKYRRAAKQRLTSAQLRLQHDLSLDAMYLGGYVVECALKALILRRVPRGGRRDIVARITRGAAAHKLESLKEKLQRLHCRMPPGSGPIARRRHVVHGFEVRGWPDRIL